MFKSNQSASGACSGKMITLSKPVFLVQGASNSLLIELGGVSVVRVKRFQDAIEQDTYCSVTGKTNQQEKVMNCRYLVLFLLLEI